MSYNVFPNHNILTTGFTGVQILSFILNSVWVQTSEGIMWDIPCYLVKKVITFAGKHVCAGLFDNKHNYC
jgi:hypothetical protein